MRYIKPFSIVLWFSTLFLSQEALSQSKFELGVGIDPLIFPINYVTYFESGPGFYDIYGRGRITRSASAYVAYWAFPAFGISLGTAIRTFGSQIDFAITDPLFDDQPPLIERSYPFRATGWGPSLAVLYRKERWRGSIGLGLFDLHNQQYTSSKCLEVVIIFESSGEILSDIEVEEEAYWRYVPTNYAFLQLEGQYQVLENLFVRVGLQATISGSYPYPYTVLISGFTPDTPPGDQVLNDYRMKNSLASVSLGIAYRIGFGEGDFHRKKVGMD